ncbi:MAG: class I SAM-dependent methyltransferase [Nevskiales bacterium]|nr:class I SAM-dependent methyltransferase [Nevskiales bacterium]
MATRRTDAPDPLRGVSFSLETIDGRLALVAAHLPKFKPLRCDWTAPEIRRRIAAGKRAPLPRAIGLHKATEPLSVLDATAGMGRDGFVLAALGARVTMVERQPLFAALLRDAHRHALADPQWRETAERIELIEADAAAVLASGRRWDVVHLDPMYPHRDKQALPGKDMQFLRELTGGDVDAGTLLEPALRAARRRVVVKRPSGAVTLSGRTPSFQLQATQTRYDVYLPMSHCAD